MLLFNMTTVAYTETESETREFVVGTTGWTADDLDDPAIERLWDQGRFEIVEGVLTQTAAARLDDSGAFLNFIFELKAHLRANKDKRFLATEADVILQNMRVPRVDAVYLDADALARQVKLHAQSRRPRGRLGRVRTVPTLIVESVSIGHEAHDRVTKRRLYAEAGVPNYWLFDAYERSLEILRLNGNEYATEQFLRDDNEFKSTLFPGLVIRLTEIWV